MKKRAFKVCGMLVVASALFLAGYQIGNYGELFPPSYIMGADTSRMIDEYRLSLLDHYSNITDLVRKLDNKYDWSDKYGCDDYSQLWDEMTKVDSIINNN